LYVLIPLLVQTPLLCNLQLPKVGAQRWFHASWHTQSVLDSELKTKLVKTIQPALNFVYPTVFIQFCLQLHIDMVDTASWPLTIYIGATENRRSVLNKMFIIFLNR
jgi:hypothetical protein